MISPYYINISSRQILIYAFSDLDLTTAHYLGCVVALKTMQEEIKNYHFNSYWEKAAIICDLMPDNFKKSL